MRRVASPPPELTGYEYQRLLGTGGFSDVFLYRQHLPRRPVAVKVLLAEELTAAARRAFVDEANLMAQLSAHPFIVTIYSADITADQRPYFVMEYCAGPSLSEQYKKERFSVVDALRTGVRLSSAVATAHAAGILHRDIKPANVLTNEYGWPALTDFGISSAVEELPVHTTTAGIVRGDDTGTGATGQSVGMSVPWSPPEMFEEDPQPDVRSDVFSLSATIWTLLAGRTPFEVPGRPNGTLDLIGRIERGAITAMDRDDVPAALIAVLTRGMAVRPADRYRSAVEFARALQRVELELGYAPTSIELPTIATAGDAEPAGEPATDDAPETRVRGVATIAAQPLAPAGTPAAPPAVAAPSVPAPAAEAETEVQPTRLRGVGTISPDAPSAPAPEHTVIRRRPEAAVPAADAAPVAGHPARARRRPIAFVAAGAIVVVAAIVTVSIVLTAGRPAQPTPTPKASGSTAVVGGAPDAPAFLSAQPSADGTTVTFRFAPVKNAAGYQWAPAESPSQTQPTVQSPTVVRTGVTPGQRVCVQIVTIATDGRTSDPAVGCYPSE